MTRTGQPRLVRRAYRFSLDLNNAQAGRCHEIAGLRRTVYNWGLDVVKAAVEARRSDPTVVVPNKVALTKLWPQVRDGLLAHPDTRPGAEPGAVRDYAWTRQFMFRVPQTALADLSEGIGAFLASQAGRRRGPKVRFPKYKSKKDRTQGFWLDVRELRVPGQPCRELPDRGKMPPGKIWMSDLGIVRVHDTDRLGQLARRHRRGLHPDIVGSLRITRASIKYEHGRWWLSLLTEQIERAPAKPTAEQLAAHPDRVIGMDVGIRVYAALSDGTRIDSPTHQDRDLKRIRKLTGKLRRQQEGSARRNKTKKINTRVHARVAMRRQEFLHTTTAALVKNHAEHALVVENVNWHQLTRSNKGTLAKPGKGVATKRSVNRQIRDRAFGEFRFQLGYKAERTGMLMLVAPDRYPSTQICSQCGAKAANRMRPWHFEFTCACGLRMDRDDNAAANLANWGRAHLQNLDLNVAATDAETINARRKSAPARTGAAGIAAGTEQPPLVVA